MGKDITVGDRIASEMFTNGLPGVYRYLEEYYKSLYHVSIPYEVIIKMPPENAIKIIDDMPSRCFSCEYLRCYTDFETHDFVMIFRKPGENSKMNKTKSKRKVKRDIKEALVRR